MTRLSTALLICVATLWLVAAGLPGGDVPPSAHAAANWQQGQPVPATAVHELSASDPSEASVTLLLGILGFSGLALFNLRLRKPETPGSESSST